jgi:hypothetical protein
VASITDAEAQYFSVASPPCRIAVHERVTDQLFGRIPFVYVDGHALNVAYVSGSGLDAYGSFSTSFPTVDVSELALSHYATVLEVDSAILGHYGNRRDIVKALIGVKVDALLERVRKAFLMNLDAAASANFMTANAGAGGTVLTGEIDALLSLLSPGEDLSKRYLVMHGKALKHLRANNYQNEIYFIQDPELGPLPTIGGVPVLIDNYILTNDPPGDRTSILALYLEPYTGAFGVLPCAHRGREIRVLGPYPREGTDLLTYHVQMQAGATVVNPLSVAKLLSVSTT